MKLILAYVKMDLTHIPRTQDVVQAGGVGRTQAEHFLWSMRRLESDAGISWCHGKKLSGRIVLNLAATALIFMDLGLTTKLVGL